MSDPITGETSNWGDTFTDSNGDTYHYVDWGVFSGKVYEKDDDGTRYDTTNSDFFGNTTEIEKEWP